MIAWLKIPFFFHHSSPLPHVLHVLFLCILWVCIEVSAMSYWISYWINRFDLVPGAVRQCKEMFRSCFLANEHMRWCRGAAVMRFEYLTVMNIKIMVSVDVTLCTMRGLFLRNVLYVYSVLTLMFLINSVCISHIIWCHITKYHYPKAITASDSSNKETCTSRKVEAFFLFKLNIRILKNNLHTLHNIKYLTHLDILLTVHLSIVYFSLFPTRYTILFRLHTVSAILFPLHVSGLIGPSSGGLNCTCSLWYSPPLQMSLSCDCWERSPFSTAARQRHLQRGRIP